MKILALVLSIAVFILGGGECAHAAVYEFFPGFKTLYDRADFVGIVTLAPLNVSEKEREAYTEWIRPHRFFKIKSVIVFKGESITGGKARLADRRLGRPSSATSPPHEEILIPGRSFLVFLNNSSQLYGPLFKWDEVHAEGAVLPIAPNTRIDSLDRTKPFEMFELIVADYTRHCKTLLEHAQAQEKAIKDFGTKPR